MNTTTTRVPSLGAVIREEARATALLQRWTFGLIGLVVLWLVGMALWGLFAALRQGQLQAPAEMSPLPIFLMLAGSMTFLGALWPTSVWKHLGPSQRGYIWSLPVERPAQSLIRTAIGWATLMLVVAALMGVVALAAMVVRSQLPEFAISPSGWFLPFTGATIAYLVVSPLALLTDHPAKWLVGGFFGLLILRASLEISGVRGLGDVWDAAVGSFTYATVRASGDPLPYAWGVHLAIWLGLGIAATAAAILAHQER
jgi:hypothetical protein